MIDERAALECCVSRKGDIRWGGVERDAARGYRFVHYFAAACSYRVFFERGEVELCDRRK